MTDAPDEAPPAFYVFLTAGPDMPSRMVKALADIFALPSHEIELYESDHVEDCTWDTQMQCEWTAFQGDITWSFHVSAADSVAYQPSEKDLAVRLAREMGAPILFPSTRSPATWWLVTTNGELTYACLEEPEESNNDFTVYSVAFPVPEFPNARVSDFSRG